MNATVKNIAQTTNVIYCQDNDELRQFGAIHYSELELDDFTSGNFVFVLNRELKIDYKKFAESFFSESKEYDDEKYIINPSQNCIQFKSINKAIAYHMKKVRRKYNRKVRLGRDLFDIERYSCLIHSDKSLLTDILKKKDSLIFIKPIMINDCLYSMGELGGSSSTYRIHITMSLLNEYDLDEYEENSICRICNNETDEEISKFCKCSFASHRSCTEKAGKDCTKCRRTIDFEDSSFKFFTSGKFKPFSSRYTKFVEYKSYLSPENYRKVVQEFQKSKKLNEVKNSENIN